MRQTQAANILRSTLVAAICLALSACAMGQNFVTHSFSFDAISDSPDVEVLDYQYGNGRQFGTRAEKERIALGEVFRVWRMFGAMPRGEFLYVKWRIKQSTQVYQDKVDLTTRLPANIAGSGVHFVIRGPQLYVYLIPPPGIWSASVREAHGYLKQHQVYPDRSGP